MSTTYSATLTNVGASQVADAIAQGTTLTWVKMALGDGNGSAVTVDASRTSLVNEQYRAPLNDLVRDSANPNTIVGTLVVPPETGGWTIREFGIYDNAATPNLVAYGETPEIEKPASSAGTGINLRLRFKLVVSADANITLSPDSNEAYATIEYVKDNAVKSLSISGRTITYTMGDGDTHTIQTQDTTYNDATQSVHGLMSVNDKKKMDGIEEQAEVNQNAFSKIKIGNITVEADTKTDTVELVAGNSITLTANASNDKITIAVTSDIFYPISGGLIQGNSITFSGSSPHIGPDTTDKYFRVYQGNDFFGGGSLYLFGKDIEPSEIVGQNEPGAFRLTACNGIDYHSLIGYADGRLEWNGASIIYGPATQSANGLMSASDKIAVDKLGGNINLVSNTPLISSGSSSKYLRLFNSDYNGGASLYLYGKDNTIGNGAFTLNAYDGTTRKQFVGSADGTLTWDGNDVIYIHPTTSGNKHIPSGGSSGQILRWSADGTATWGNDNNTDTQVTATKITYPSSEQTYFILGSASEATTTESVYKFGNEVCLKIKSGTASVEGQSAIVLGNTIATGTTGNVTGLIRLHNDKGKHVNVYPHSGDTSNRGIYTPKANGTLVCHTTDTKVGDSNKPVYINANGVATACSFELNKTVPENAVFTDTVPGPYTSINFNAVTTTNNAITNLGSFTPTKSGMYFIHVAASYEANGTGLRRLGIGTSTTSGNMDRFVHTRIASASSGASTDIQMSCLISMTANSTYYINVQQNSGGNLSVSGGVRAYYLGSA